VLRLAPKSPSNLDSKSLGHAPDRLCECASLPTALAFARTAFASHEKLPSEREGGSTDPSDHLPPPLLARALETALGWPQSFPLLILEGPAGTRYLLEFQGDLTPKNRTLLAPVTLQESELYNVGDATTDNSHYFYLAMPRSEGPASALHARRHIARHLVGSLEKSAASPTSSGCRRGVSPQIRRKERKALKASDLGN
jgi:hypothetical protein